MINLKQAPQPGEGSNWGKQISNLWSSKNRITRLIILATTGLVLNCCCVIIPLSTKAHSVAAQSNVGIPAIPTSEVTAAQDPFGHMALAIPVRAGYENNRDRSVGCQDFNSHAAFQEAAGTTDIQSNRSDKDGRLCISAR